MPEQPAISLPVQTTTAQCRRCGSALSANDLACPACHALVHAEELERITAEAKALELKSDFLQARELWLSALALLPPESRQSDWISARARALLLEADKLNPSESENAWAKRMAPLGPIAVLLLKGKGLLALFNAKFLFSLAAFMGVYWKLYGALFGVGFAVLILVHEMGHFIDVKRRGLPADMPVFLPGFGAYVRWQAIGVTAETRAFVSLAGPLAGCIASIVCAVMWWTTGNGLWAALARASAWLNILNLVPVWALDGGQAAGVLSKTQRFAVLTTCLALWMFLHESVFFIVACGAAYRLFTKDMPEQPSRATAVYFVVLLVALGVTMWLMPGQGFGTP